MKFAVKIVLLMFVVFLSTPTVLEMFSDDVPTSVIYNLNEEECDSKKVKTEIQVLFLGTLFPFFSKKTVRFSSDYQLKYDNILKDIVLPPPDTF